MDNIQNILMELLSDFNALKKERKTFRLMLEDIERTTNSQYVTEASQGFFPDRSQPAFLCLRAAVYLVNAAQFQGPEMVKNLEAALTDVEKAQWDGTDMNTGQLKSNFLKLRWDKDARSPDEYNHKLAELYNFAGDLFESARGSGGVPHVENIFTAVAQIATVASIPNKAPFSFSPEEQSQAIPKAVEMIKFAIRVAKTKA